MGRYKNFNWNVPSKQIIEQENINTKKINVGDKIKTKDHRTGVVTGIYTYHIRVNITAGENVYSECFKREDIEKI